MGHLEPQTARSQLYTNVNVLDKVLLHLLWLDFFKEETARHMFYMQKSRLLKKIKP